MRSPPYPDKKKSFILSAVNALLDKAGENGLRLVGGVRFLDMQLQECQYILLIIMNSQLPIHVSLILSSLFAFLQWWL